MTPAERRARQRGSQRGGDARARKAATGQGAHPATSERTYSDDEREFLQAMQAYKARSGRMFPTWSEVLGVVRDLGYRKPDATSLDR